MKQNMENGVSIVRIDTLAFISERRGYSWLGREFRHFRLKHALKKAGRAVVPSAAVAAQLHAYYGFPLEKIDILD